MPKLAQNIYRCIRCQREIVTRDIADGVTPYVIKGVAHGAALICDERMISQFYPVEAQARRPSHVFVRKTEWERNHMGPYDRAHHDDGGLFLEPSAA
jgi:hypothetical protein